MTTAELAFELSEARRLMGLASTYTPEHLAGLFAGLGLLLLKCPEEHTETVRAHLIELEMRAAWMPRHRLAGGVC